jgi:hypothetical protein
MAHAPALRGCFPCWRADAGLPSDGLRPAQRQGVTERTLRRPVLEQRGGHKIILPSPAGLSPGICRGSVAEKVVHPVAPSVAPTHCARPDLSVGSIDGSGKERT